LQNATHVRKTVPAVCKDTQRALRSGRKLGRDRPVACIEPQPPVMLYATRCGIAGIAIG